jgi:NAD(P)-dependent dehydrogenase (short-subunit alcohol dehydrogenase family)
MEFAGATAVVTGAASGIGRATAVAFGKEGANVALLDIDEDGARRIAQQIDETGERTAVHRVDMADVDAVRSVLHDVDDRFGGIDALANVAAIFPHASVDDTTEELWDHVVSIGLRGVFFCCQEALRIMVPRGQGAIVNVSSSIAFSPRPNLVAYAAAKGGVVAMSRVLALEHARSGVRINVVAPGPTFSEKTPARMPQWEEFAADLVPGRWIDPEEQANAVVWLCSDAASGCNGAIINVTGGVYMP